MSEQDIDLGIGAAPIIATELDMDLPPVRTFVDGELVSLDTKTPAIAPINQSAERSALSIGLLDSADELVAADLGISLVGSVSACVERAVSAQNTAVALVLEAGYLMLKAKSECEHGDFLKLLKAHDVTHQTASDLMLTAKFYTRLEPEQRKQVFTLSKTKLRALAAADPEVVKDFLEDPSEDLTLSVRELRQRLRDMESLKNQTIKVLQADLEHERSRNELLTKKDHRVYSFDLQTHLIREECLAHQAEVELALNSLRQLFEDCVSDDNKVERDLRIEQVWVTLHVAAARAMDALAFLRGFGLEGMPDSISHQHWLTDDEALRWLDDYERVEHKHIKSKIERHDKREAAKPKGPGRPRKDK